MRQVVVHETLDEIEARPPTVFHDLVEACIESARQVLTEPNELVGLRSCPACGASPLVEAFSKHGYGYRHCRGCWSLYTVPRPSPEQLCWYLHDSPAADYRRRPEYVEAISTRMHKWALDWTDWVSELAAHPCRGRYVVQFGARGLQLLDQLHRRGIVPLACAGVLPPAVTLDDRPYRVFPKPGDVEDGSARVVAAFDVMEHQIDPAALLHDAYRALAPGGHLVLTTRSGSGFDVQILWDHADVFPLEHITLLSVEGMRLLLEQIGFEVMEISTPGLLDLKVIQRTMREVATVRIPRFLEYLLSHRDVRSIDSLQEYLQQQRLSSHMRVFARK